MYSRDLRFRIQQEQRSQANALLSALLVVVFAVVTTALAPQLFYEYFLQDAALEQQMLTLKYIPAVSYGVAVAYFLFALVSNFARSRKIRFYQQELEIMAYMDDCGDCCKDGSCAECMSMEQMSEEMVAEEEKPAAKKTVKKTAKKKTTK